MPQTFSLFDEIIILLTIAIAAGILVMRFRQPPIIGFIAVGILAGPSGLSIIKSTDQIHLLSEMGLALLLFIVGLKLDINMMRKMGVSALLIGLSQIVITTLGGYILSLALGMNLITSLYVAVALTLSSTIIIIKLLSDKNETDSLYGRIAIGLLIIQDIVVVLVMVFLSAFSSENQNQPFFQAALIVIKGAVFIGAVLGVSVYLIPKLLLSIAKSSEMLVLFGIVWALAVAAIGELFGFSKEIGAFVAGVSLSSTHYRDIIGIKLASLRDFLLLFFFIELGSRLNISTLGSQVWSAIPLTLYVLIGNPIIMLIITGVMGYRKRTSFLAGITVGQVSEFSLILIAMGAKLGHIGNDTVSLVTFVALVSIAFSTYMIIYSQELYSYIKPSLRIFERKKTYREDTNTLIDGTEPADIIIFGLGNYGTGIAEQFEERGRRILGIDFDPIAVSKWNDRGFKAIFGDAQDPEIINGLHLSHVKWVISSVRNRNINTSLLNSLEQVGYTGHVAVAECAGSDDDNLCMVNVDIIFNPFDDAAVQAVDLIFATEDEIERKAMENLIETMSDHYIVCGYGRMGQQIIKDLEHDNVPCVVVEWNPEQLPVLKENNVLHIIGNASEDITLIRAGVKRAKGLIAVAASDEENVFIVLTAKVLNPNLFIVARSIRKENEDKLRHAGASMVVSPYILGGHQMAAAIIKPEVMDFLELVVHSDIIDAEMATITVPTGSNCIGKTLHDVNPWESCRVTLLAIRREGEPLIANPDPGLVIKEKDQMIVMGTPSQITAAKQLLEV